MTRSFGLRSLALTAILMAGLEPLAAQNPMPVPPANPYRMLRTRPHVPISTHSQLEKAPRNLGRRGIRPPALEQSIKLESRLRQQSDQLRRHGTFAPATPIGTMELRQRYSQQSSLAAAEQQRMRRALQTTPNGGWFGQRTEQRMHSSSRQQREKSAAPTFAPAAIDQDVAGLPSHPSTSSKQSRARASQAGHESAPQPRGTRNALAFHERFTKRVYPNGAPNYEQLRSRVSRTGRSPREWNSRLGRAIAPASASQPAARFGSARVRR